MECFVIFVMAWCWLNATESKPQNVSNNFMKNRTIIFFFLIFTLIIGCDTKEQKISADYFRNKTFTFYVKNTSDKTVSFDASVMKFSQSGPYDVNQSFTVKPNDSVLARKVSMRNDVSPEKWFTQFNIFPTDSLEFNDPKNPQNWVKTIGKDGKPIYTFNIVK